MQALTVQNENPPRETTVRLIPRVDVVENERDVLLLAELPGVVPGDLELTVDGDELTLRATRPMPEGEADRRYERRFQLGRGLSREGMEAKLENGLLRLTIPREDQRKRIEVQVG